VVHILTFVVSEQQHARPVAVFAATSERALAYQDLDAQRAVGCVAVVRSLNGSTLRGGRR
jgi:hypothetical protein